jgi:DNA primase
MIPDEIIKKLKDSIDIVEFISPQLRKPLKKKGKHWVGHSKWTNDTSPSLKVNAETQTWYDYASSRGGDVISFVMEVHGLSFTEAVHELCDIAGVVISDTEYAIVESKAQALLNQVQQEWHEALLQSKTMMQVMTGDGVSSIRGVEVKNRTFSSEAVKHLSLGLSSLPSVLHHPDGDLPREAKEMANETGILSVDEGTGRVFPVFQGRYLFPYIERSGCKGWSGRDILGYSQAKYKNSPASKFFDKTELVYGLYLNRSYIRKSLGAIHVESCASVAGLWSVGIKNCVASNGTSVTVEHARKVSRHTRNVTCIGDGDMGGLVFVAKCIQAYFSVGIMPYVCVCKTGQDPDDMRKNIGMEEWIEENKVSAIEFVYQRWKSLDDPTAKAKELRFLMDACKEIPDEELLLSVMDVVSQKFGVSQKKTMLVLSESAEPKQSYTSGIDQTTPEWIVLSHLCQFPSAELDGVNILDFAIRRLGLKNIDVDYPDALNALRWCIATGKDPLRNENASSVYARMVSKHTEFNASVFIEAVKKLYISQAQKYMSQVISEYTSLQAPTVEDANETEAILQSLQNAIDAVQ